MTLELIKYLNDNFVTLPQLLESTKMAELEFRRYQEAQLMPKASYVLNLSLNCDSFFGLHYETHAVEYYAKGYASWLGIVRSLQEPDCIYAEFSRRYTSAIELLKAQGHRSDHPKVGASLPAHIAEEWRHFINGIYGLCTKSGLPEDIAAKEFAISQINELTEHDSLSGSEVEKLQIAVNLLDAASSAFAPHERLKSSRQRLVNEVRRLYQLQS